MKIAIIGAGNMGGAIARGLARGKKISSSQSAFQRGVRNAHMRSITSSQL